MLRVECLSPLEQSFEDDGRPRAGSSNHAWYVAICF